MGELVEEGWYTDPYEIHEARWFSAGKPTKLVRDGEDESYDAPPETPYKSQPVAIVATPEDAEPYEVYDDQRANRAAWDAFDQRGAPTAERIYEGEEYPQ